MNMKDLSVLGIAAFVGLLAAWISPPGIVIR